MGANRKQVNAILRRTAERAEAATRLRVAEYICCRFTCALDDCRDCEPGSVALEHADTILALVHRR